MVKILWVMLILFVIALVVPEVTMANDESHGAAMPSPPSPESYHEEHLSSIGKISTHRIHANPLHLVVVNQVTQWNIRNCWVSLISYDSKINA